MAKLWKDVFHDSDQYISLIFSNYFDPSYVEYEEVDGEIVAGLIGIPYEFGNSEIRLKGLYLCRLATRPRFRSGGIMTRLLNKINEKAAEKGFAFTFLIPGDPGLRKYYHDRDYVNAFYRVVDNYTSLHNFDLEYDSLLAEQKDKVAVLKKRYYDSLKPGFIDKDNDVSEDILGSLKELIRNIEERQLDLQIVHTDKDLENIVKENAISGGKIYYIKNGGETISAVAFTSKSEDGVNVHKLYTADPASKYKVLGAIKNDEPELGIHLYVPSIEMDRNALWSRTYGSFMPESPQVATISITERIYSLAAHAKMYGMARILNLDEILKFQAAQRHDLRYSLLVKSSDAYTIEHIEAKNGEVSIKKLPVNSIDPSKLAYVMSRRDVSEILFRRRDTDNLITEAFGIPSINGSISLMFD